MGVILLFQERHGWLLLLWQTLFILNEFLYFRSRTYWKRHIYKIFPLWKTSNNLLRVKRPDFSQGFTSLTLLLTLEQRGGSIFYSHEFNHSSGRRGRETKGGRVKEKSKGSRREKKTGAWDQNIQRYCSNRYMWAWSLRAGDKSLKECSGTLKGPRPIRDGSRCQQVCGDSFFDFLVKATRDL